MIDTEQFGEWLFQGLGRPHRYLRDNDSRPYHERLLHACLYNPVFDRQCAGPRADYLHALVALTPDPAAFQQPILDALAAPDDQADVEQLFDFALIFARQGSARARELMYEQFAAHAGDGSDTGATQLIELDGLAGFRAVAARLGEAARADPEFWDSDHLLRALGERAPGADIAALGRADPAIQRYLDVVAATEARRAQGARQRRALLSAPYATLRAQLALPRRPSALQLRRWGQSASDADSAAAAHDLLRQGDPLSLAAYLAIFELRPFPLGLEPLLPLARHPHERVARRALQALSLFEDARLHQLGRELLHEGWLPDDALGLFVRNARPGDDAVFLELLGAARDHEQVHDLCFGLIDLLEHSALDHAFALRSLIYERQPCALCRAKVVRQLVATASMPAWMSDECRYDADEQTRAAVAG